MKIVRIKNGESSVLKVVNDAIVNAKGFFQCLWNKEQKAYFVRTVSVRGSNKSHKNGVHYKKAPNNEKKLLSLGGNK